MTGNALLLSIKPRFADAIFAKAKGVELRRVRPRVSAGDLILVYVTSPRCALEGAFEVERVLEARPSALWQSVRRTAGITKTEFDDYYRGSKAAYGIVVRRVWKLAPVSLAALRRARIRPPQSYHYIDAVKALRLGDKITDRPAVLKTR